ncbi:MAG: flagellar hook capping FlgD N-terminal domain-containing protein [Pirellulales bacterium]|nr:hypothetical protein [Planctomycetales bacterium]
METSGVGASSQATSNGKNDALRGLELGHFIELMVAELQNQDPLDPMDNSEILQQISQIREIDVSDRLGQTLDSVLAGQNFASASAMVGKYVRALTDADGYIEGAVDSVSIAGGQVKVHIGAQTVAMDKVAEIFNEEPTADTNNLATDGAAS